MRGDTWSQFGRVCDSQFRRFKWTTGSGSHSCRLSWAELPAAPAAEAATEAEARPETNVAIIGMRMDTHRHTKPDSDSSSETPRPVGAIFSSFQWALPPRSFVFAAFSILLYKSVNISIYLLVMRLLDSTFYPPSSGRCIYMCRVLTIAPVAVWARTRRTQATKICVNGLWLGAGPSCLCACCCWMHWRPPVGAVDGVGVTMSHFHKHENEMSENVLHFFVCLYLSVCVSCMCS